MQHDRARAVHLAICIGFALTLILCLPGQLHAQRRISEQERNESDLADREFSLRTLGKFKKEDLEVGPATINLKQVKKDFEGMQLANNNILVALASKRPLDPKQISEDTSKIRRFAGSLKTQLSLPAPDADKTRKERNEPLQEPLRDALLHLDAFIVRFVTNPIFKSNGLVVDASHGVQARRDLDDIIDMCDRIRKLPLSVKK